MQNFKKIVAVVLMVATILSLTIIPASANNAPTYGVITASALNLRTAPTTANSTIITAIPNGGYVKVNEVIPGWLNVTYNDSMTGYVCSDYVAVYYDQMPSRAQSSSKGQAVVELAKQYLGTPYVYGGASPSGFDCSGLVYYVYKQMGVTLNRTTYDQMKNGIWVDKSQLQPGDIIGFYNSSGIGHVGLYVGNGMMIHSPYTGTVVRYESIVSGSYANRYAGARRIFY